ncbi:probable galacturonosyltransferase 6 isoform X2 [Alnus glutinosa]|uniref:probable galacturonosyltransferase 6 isoform X2 n=1 Tax=Alnus glutinosa TaxID=3517 RepID=UPI002D770CFA|nr:probable galacturonosyltransferase 6 isoform X2 [Alnus glutinosa]
MKPIRRCLRILILALLSVTVFAPIVFFSNRLKHLSQIGRKEFVQDLSNIKYRADAALKLNAIEQESGEDLKEPKQVVYEDRYLGSVASYSSNKNRDIHESENAGDTAKILERNETNHERTESQQLQQREISSTDGEVEHSNQTTVEHDHNAHSQHWRITDEKITEMKDGTRVWLDQNLRSHSRKVTNEIVTEMKDQVIRAKAYLSFTPPGSNSHFVKELKQRIREVERAVGQATKDSNLSRSSLQKMRGMEATLLKASHVFPDCSDMATKLRSMTHNTEELVQSQRNQAAHLVRLAARTTPKGLHCLSMRLTADYFALQPEERLLPNQQKLQDTELYHYAVFSDNVLACAVVVNSTISTAMDSERIVFHVVTDSLNLPAISMWFLLNPPGKATIQIQSIDNFEWLSTKYNTTLKKQSAVDPRYISELNQLRFYLLDVFPALDKIVLFDHDVVVQRDLTGLWRINMKGKVNGAVETCHENEALSRRMDLLINFSDPLVAKRFDVNACTWAFGMNFFDLQEWRRQNLTDVYHKYLQLGNKRPLWKAGSLPLGWITFYNQTMALDRRWHVLGLGYDLAVKRGDIERAAVIHYDGVMKPWLDIAIGKYKDYWSQYVQYDHPYLQQCNIHE